jgi:hypothetical protein
VEASLWQPSLIEYAMESMANDCAIERSSTLCREHQLRVLPSFTSNPFLPELPISMFTKSNNNGCRQCHGSSTPWRLRLNELERTVDSLELLVYSKVAHFEVYVLPPDTQRLALAQTHSQRNGVQSFQSVASNCS